MTLNISFLHTDSTPAIREKIENKASHITKYFSEKVDIQWTCSVDNHQHSSIVTVRAGHRYFYAKATADTLYKTFDQVVQKIENQIHHKKDDRDNQSLSEFANA